MSTALPPVSIILCCYNQEDFVRKSIESALNQTYENTEVWIIDNGSTDGTRKVILEYQDHPRAKLLLFDENGFVTKRQNEAIRRSRGEYVSILYSDDYYLPNKIERQVEAFKGLGKDYGVVYSPGMRVNTVTGEEYFEKCMRVSGNVLETMFVDYHENGFIDPVSPLIRRECFNEYPFQEGTFLEGEGIFFRIAISYKFFFLDEVLSVMSDHPNNIGKAVKRTKEVAEYLMGKILEEPGFPKSLRQALKTYHARVLVSYGWQCVRLAPDRSWARVCFGQLWKWDPLQYFNWRVLVGFVFSFLPDGVMGQINEMINARATRKRVFTFREGYQ